MPTNPPSIPSTPNLSDGVKKPDTILTDGNGNRVWAEMWLQEAWDQEWSVDSPVRTEGPSHFTGTGPRLASGETLPPGRYCKKLLTRSHFRRPMGLFYYYGYTIEESWSGWEIAGAILVGIACVAAVAVGIGAVVGAAWAVTAATATTAATLTAGATSILAASGTLVAAGGIIVAKAEEGEEKGTKINGSEGYIYLPLAEANQYHTEDIVVQEWHVC